MSARRWGAAGDALPPPLRVDPRVERFRQNNIGNVDPGGTWVIGHEHDQETADWNYNYGGEGSHLFAWPPQTGDQQPQVGARGGEHLR
jgi:hypothetical protein